MASKGTSEHCLRELTLCLGQLDLKQEEEHKDQDEDSQAHFDLLRCDPADEHSEELSAAPIFTAPVLKYSQTLDINPPPLTQYGLLGAVCDKRFRNADDASSAGEDPRLFFNAVPPSSVFICGSQGSGKSHTLSCLLENCLIRSKANVLPRPLTGVVFHYDPWCSDTGGSACEAAYLSSSDDVSVRVLCSPTNIFQIKRIYGHLPGVKVEALRLNQSDLNTQRMMDLMAVSSSSGPVPLYIHVVTRILRELRITQQASGSSFDYLSFRRMLEGEDLTVAQSGPLQQRLDALESFMKNKQATGHRMYSSGNSWTPKAGQLTIVDLSCPCVTVETACSLFNICLSLFLEQKSAVGRVVALDEAHKFMTETAECRILTDALLSNIRLQRHQALRVMIATQEPTISPKLLDLCAVTIVHRFTSPDWLQSLKKHLAGASAFSQGLTSDGVRRDGAGGVLRMDPEELTTQLFSKIVALRRGEALMFSPSAIIGVGEAGRRKSKSKAKSELGERPKLEPKMEGGVRASKLLWPGNPTPGASNPSSEAGADDCDFGDDDDDEDEEDEHEDEDEDADDELGEQVELVKLGHGVLNIRVRKRVTEDGGRSIMAA